MSIKYEKARTIKAVTFDGDGVVFTGHAFTSSRGGELKRRSLVDGQGVCLLRAIGVRVALVSAEKTGQLEAVGKKWNATQSAADGTWGTVEVLTGFTGAQKVDKVGTWLDTLGMDWLDCAHMGDDLSDWALLGRVHLPAAPVQAEKTIKELVRQKHGFIAERAGGDGAIRDFADFILRARSIDPTTLPLR